MKQLIIKALKLISLVVVLSISPAFILLLLEKPPVNYSPRGRMILTPVVPPGGELQIKISADINKTCVSEVTRSIVDSTGVKTEFEEKPRPQETDYIVRIIVPLGAAIGPAKYSARLLWSCNIVQKFFPQEVIQRGLDFTIAPAEGQLPVPEKQGVYEAPERKSELAGDTRVRCFAGKGSYCRRMEIGE